jgi:hypothetical protein
MKTLNRMRRKFCGWSLLIILLGLLTTVGHAVTLAPGGTNSISYTTLNWFSFNDTNAWTSGRGYVPVSFTNLAASKLGNGNALVINSNQAFLQFNVYETNGATNLTVDVGSVVFWFAPAWASTNKGGFGPGEWGRLLEVGGYTPDSSFGLWSLYVDDVGQNVYFSAQTNDLSSNFCTYVSAPISWASNYWHCVALTYSATNTALYLDGQLATNGPPITNYPGANALANGFFIGSDSNGLYQAQGMLDDLYTYATPLDADTIASIYNMDSMLYYGNPYNRANFTSGSSSQTTFTPFNDVITGPGNLQLVGTTSCSTGATAYSAWLTNVVATAGANGMMNIQFSIEGGASGVPFDVFANSTLSFGANGVPWLWQGQGYSCSTYQLTNLPGTACFLILGTPVDSDLDGLTDAYEMLVSKSGTNTYSTDGTGMADGWEVLYFGHTGIDPSGDPDGDGLTTFQEWLMNSQGYNPVQWNSSTNSIVGDGFQDYSGDGLANLMTASFGGSLMTNNPTWRVNTTGDGLPDLYKTMVGLSTNSPAPVLGLPAYSKNPVP